MCLYVSMCINANQMHAQIHTSDFSLFSKISSRKFSVLSTAFVDRFLDEVLHVSASPIHWIQSGWKASWIFINSSVSIWKTLHNLTFFDSRTKLSFQQSLHSYYSLKKCLHFQNSINFHQVQSLMMFYINKLLYQTVYYNYLGSGLGTFPLSGMWNHSIWQWSLHFYLYINSWTASQCHQWRHNTWIPVCF